MTRDDVGPCSCSPGDPDDAWEYTCQTGDDFRLLNLLEGRLEINGPVLSLLESLTIDRTGNVLEQAADWLSIQADTFQRLADELWTANQRTEP